MLSGFDLAVIQFEAAPGDKKANLERAEHWLRQVGQRGVKMAVLQENFLTVYPSREFAEPVPGPSTEPLQKIAREHKMYIVAGTMLERDGDKLFVTVPFIAPNGDILGKYHKVHLVDFPQKDELGVGCTRGTEYPVYRLDLCTAGILLGGDLDPPEPARILGLRGVEVLLAPHQCTANWVDAHRYILKARAWENMYYVAAANPVGMWRDSPVGQLSYLGGSQVVSPMGEVLASAGEFREGFAIATIDLDYLARTRRENEWKTRRQVQTYRAILDN